MPIRISMVWTVCPQPSDLIRKQMVKVWLDSNNWFYYYQPVEDRFYRQHIESEKKEAGWWVSREGFGR